MTDLKITVSKSGIEDFYNFRFVTIEDGKENILMSGLDTLSEFNNEVKYWTERIVKA